MSATDPVVETMSILDSIVKTRAQAPRITIYGKPGIGKSTLAAQFPRPLFILTEDPSIPGLDSITVGPTFIDMWETIKSLVELEEIPYKTIVIDSVSKLDSLVINHILDEDQKTKGKGTSRSLTTANGGYGAGFDAAQGIHRAFKRQCDKFTQKGLAVVFIAHLDVIKHKSPDNEDYDIYSIVMNHNKSRSVYIDDVDAVLFGRLKTYTNETGSGRTIVKSSENRVLITSVNDANVSKNRFGMPNEIPMTFENIKKYIPFYNKNEEL